MASLQEIDDLLAPPPATAHWGELLRRLDALDGSSELPTALARADAALEAWPDRMREAPRRGWQAILDGEAAPSWWPAMPCARLRNGLRSSNLSGVRVTVTPMNSTAPGRPTSGSQRHKPAGIPFSSSA